MTQLEAPLRSLSLQPRPNGAPVERAAPALRAGVADALLGAEAAGVAVTPPTGVAAGLDEGLVWPSHDPPTITMALPSVRTSS